MAKYGVKPKPVKELGKTAKWYRQATPAQRQKHVDSSAKANQGTVQDRVASAKARKRLHIRDPHTNAGHTKGGGFQAVSDKKNKGYNGSGNRSRYHA